MSQQYVTIKKEVKKLKQRVQLKPPEDIWIVIGSNTYDDPEEMVEAFRVPSKAFPENCTIKCKYGDLDRKIEEAKNRECLA